MKLKLKLAVLLYLLAGVLAACETLPPARPIPPPAEAVTLDQIAQALAARQDAIHNIKSRVKTAIKTKEHSHSLKQAILIEEDNALRLDTLSLFGQPLGILISDKKQILLYDVDSNRLYRDREVWNIMVRTFGTVFDFREYISVLSGKIPRLDSLNLREVQWNSKTGHYDVTAADPERNEQLRIGVDPETLLPARLTKWRNRQLLYVAQWEDYQVVEGQPTFPQIITVQRPSLGDEMVMKFSNVRINQGVPADSFQLNIPNSN